ncbi:MAG: hypothetical protein ACI4XL_05780 [Bacillus sp. (in: firmicutes)]
MKKLVGWTLTLATLLICGVIYYFITYFLYEPSKDLFGFPVPRNAELIEESELGKSYEWSKASEENGIPFGYELVLKANGWKKGEREGASVIYTKGKHRIDLISSTKQLYILKVN